MPDTAAALKPHAAPPAVTITPVRIVSASVDEVCYDVVRAVAEARGVEPTELDERLADVVDPDGLESVVRLGTDEGGDVSGAVEFDFSGCRVCVTCDGDVEVRPL